MICLHPNSVSMVIFQANLYYLVDPWSSSFTCSRTEPTEISGTDFYGSDVLPLIHTNSVSKHSRNILLLKYFTCKLTTVNAKRRPRHTSPPHHHTTTVLRPFFRDHPGEPVPEENFWTLWCKGRLTEADTLTIRLGTTPSGLTSAQFHHPPYFLRAGCPSCRQTNSVTALKATCAFGLGRRC